MLSGAAGSFRPCEWIMSPLCWKEQNDPTSERLLLRRPMGAVFARFKKFPKEVTRYGKHRISCHCDCGSRGSSARRRERTGFLAKREERPLQHQRGPAQPLGRCALLRCRSRCTRQDLLQDRRLGTRARMGAWKVAL